MSLKTRVETKRWTRRSDTFIYTPKHYSKTMIHKISIHTFLHDVQVFPENVPHEWWSSLKKRFLSEGTHFSSLHGKVVHVHSFQGELFDCPEEPMFDVLFTPISRITRDLMEGTIFLKTTETRSQGLGHLERCPWSQWRHLGWQICLTTRKWKDEEISCYFGRSSCKQVKLKTGETGERHN